MKKRIFWISYITILLVPPFLYLGSSGFLLDTYTLSVFLGVSAFVLLCNQLILASRPRFIVESIGQKAMLSLHSVVPVLILFFGVAHKILKEVNGYSDSSFQASFGVAGWWSLLIIVVFTVLFMANTFVMKIDFFKKIRVFVNQKTGLTYTTARIIHNVMVISLFILMIHVFLASTSDFTTNPIGIISMFALMMFSSLMYIRYRLKGRKG